MEAAARKSQIPPGGGEPKASGQVISILPAHGGSNATPLAGRLGFELSQAYRLAVLRAEFRTHGFQLLGTSLVDTSMNPPKRLDSRISGAFLHSSGDGFDTLEARDADPRHIKRLLDCARERYAIACADLSDARESTALEVLRNSDSIFLVANSDALSIEMARHRADWLRALGLGERSALLLNRVVGGVSGADAEDRTGLAVCTIVDDLSDLSQLAHWIAGPLLPLRAAPLPIRLVG